MNEDFLNQLNKALNLLATIPVDEFSKLIKNIHHVKINKNDFFVRAGEIQPYLGFVIAGVFRCYYIDDTGAEYTKHFFQENDFMSGNSSSFFTKETEYFFEALEDSTVLLIDMTKSGAEFETSHPCWQEVYRKTIERVHKIEERRIKQLLLENAETRYLNFRQDFPGIENRIKQSHVASYIGISPVSLSRIRSQFK